MTGTQIALIVAAVLLVILAIWSTAMARRLDRLHRKVFASRTTLNLQLAHRGAVAAELAMPGLLDPASSILVGEAAWYALSTGGHGHSELEEALPDLAVLVGPPPPPRPGHPAGRSVAARAEAESDLSRTLRQVLDDAAEVAKLRTDPEVAELLDDLAAAWYRVQLARRFHNEAVVQTQRLRRTLLVRVFSLAGRAPMPSTVDFDDAWPAGLARPDGAA